MIEELRVFGVSQLSICLCVCVYGPLPCGCRPFLAHKKIVHQASLAQQTVNILQNDGELSQPLTVATNCQNSHTYQILML